VTEGLHTSAPSSLTCRSTARAGTGSCPGHRRGWPRHSRPVPRRSMVVRDRWARC